MLNGGHVRLVAGQDPHMRKANSEDLKSYQHRSAFQAENDRRAVEQHLRVLA